MFIAFNYAPTDHFYNSTLNKYTTKGVSLYSEQEKKCSEMSLKVRL